MTLFPPSSKFSIIALELKALWLEIPELIELSEHTYLTTKPIIEKAGEWSSWLGTLTMKTLTDADVFLCSWQPSASPEILDNESHEVSNKTWRLYEALMLTIPSFAHGKALQMTGANVGGELQIRSIAHPRSIHPSHEHSGGTVTEQHINDADRVKSNLSRLGAAPGYHRLFLAFHAYKEGLKHSDLFERIHQFVRSIEGLVIPEIGKTRRQFIARSSLFSGGGMNELLGELFDIRSAFEHLHNPNDLYTGSVNFLLRGAQVQFLAQQSLRRVFLCEGLWRYFNTDDGMRNFWGLSATERTAIWGPAIELGGVEEGFGKKYIPEKYRFPGWDN